MLQDTSLQWSWDCQSVRNLPAKWFSVIKFWFNRIKTFHWNLSIPSKPSTGKPVILCFFSPAFQPAGQGLAACLALQAGSFPGSPLPVTQATRLPASLGSWALTAHTLLLLQHGPCQRPGMPGACPRFSSLQKKDEKNPPLHIIGQEVQIFYMLFLQNCS